LHLHSSTSSIVHLLPHPCSVNKPGPSLQVDEVDLALKEFLKAQEAEYERSRARDKKKQVGFRRESTRQAESGLQHTHAVTARSHRNAHVHPNTPKHVFCTDAALNSCIASNVHPKQQWWAGEGAGWCAGRQGRGQNGCKHTALHCAVLALRMQTIPFPTLCAQAPTSPACT